MLLNCVEMSFSRGPTGWGRRWKELPMERQIRAKRGPDDVIAPSAVYIDEDGHVLLLLPP